MPAEAAPAAVSRQFIPSIPGFIPVYIRNGDTPLEDINEDLAEAFDSYAIKHARLPIRARSNSILTPADEKKRQKIEKTQEKKETSKAQPPGVHAIQVFLQHEPQHIQKILKA